MSESIEMYLVMTALLRSTPQQPVAVSLLASKLGVTQVSANEMCHKLSERGLLAYQPYKGITLTEAGEAQAQAILSRRRLWVIFLVANLGIEPQEADDLACQLEHITSQRLETALKAFIERAPSMRLQTDGASGVLAASRPLNSYTAGVHGQISRIQSEPAIAAFLQGQGLTIGAEVVVLVAGADGAVLIEVGERQVALAASIASRVMLRPIAADHAARRETWARCSDFWACLHGQECACAHANLGV